MKNQLTSCSFVEITILPDDSGCSSNEQQRWAAVTSSGSSSDQQRRRQATGTRFQQLKVTSSVAEDQNSELKEFEVDNWFTELE